MIRLRGMETLVKLADVHHLVVPRIQPIERFGKERNGGKGRCRYSGAAAHDFPGCEPERSACFAFASAAVLGGLRCIRVACQRVCQFPELPTERCDETGGLAVGGGTSVVALGFPIPKAPIVLARLRRALAVERPPVRSPVVRAAAQARWCIW